MKSDAKLQSEELFLIIVIGVVGSIAISSSTNLIWADNTNPQVYSVYEKPFGITYGEWTARFWKWMISIPEQNNPNNDPTGQKCSINQNEVNVWYLAPTFGGFADRTCTIPKEKAILFPLLVGECNYIENPELKTEKELRTCAAQGNDPSRSMEAIIDGTKLQNLENYRVQTPLFDLTFPEHNAFSVKPGSSKAAGDGFWVFLKPLSVGKHLIEFSASTIDPSGVNNYNTHVKYHISVAP